MTRSVCKCPECTPPKDQKVITREEFSARLAKLAAEVWAGTETRKGRPRSTDRCPCGEMTKARAQKRGHVCYAKEMPK